MIVRQPPCIAVGKIHACSVIPEDTFSDAEAGTTTIALLPLKLSALPKRPCVLQLAPLIVPVLPLPEASLTVVPAPALNPYASTSPALGSGALCVVSIATFEYPLRLPEASVARTR